MKNTHKDNKYYTAKHNMVTIVGVTLRTVYEIYIFLNENKLKYTLSSRGIVKDNLFSLFFLFQDCQHL